jgi:hypothetical protein
MITKIDDLTNHLTEISNLNFFAALSSVLDLTFLVGYFSDFTSFDIIYESKD